MFFGYSKQNPKKGKYCFEIRIQDGHPKLFAAENESEANDWITTLNKVINAADTASLVSRDSIRGEDIISFQLMFMQILQKSCHTISM